MSVPCILCNAALVDDNIADEHVFPNAIGGRLTTRRASCEPCNTKFGDTVDKVLTRDLAYLANAFDVVRDRGEPPVLRTKDEKSGLTLQLTPGKQAAFGPNLAVRRDGDKIGFKLIAPTREEAERLLRVMANVTAPLGEKLVGTTREEGERGFQFSFPLLNAKDSEVLRAIAKIAVVFARARGVDLAADSPAIGFLRGGTPSTIPVAPARGDVLVWRDVPAHPVTHGIALCSPPGSGELWAHVVLFEALEFVVQLSSGGAKDGFHGVYRYSVVDAATEDRNGAWVASAADLHDWLTTPALESTRLANRFEHVRWWLARPREIWLQRATSAGARRFFARTDAGDSQDEAQLAAKHEMDRVLSRYDMVVQSLEVTPRTST